MEYINEWSRMSDAAQCVILFFVAYILAGVATVLYAIAHSFKQWQRERARKRTMYYWRYMQ